MPCSVKCDDSISVGNTFIDSGYDNRDGSEYYTAAPPRSNTFTSRFRVNRALTSILGYSGGGGGGGRGGGNGYYTEK